MFPAETIHYFQKMNGPVGELYVVATETHLTAVLWGKADAARVGATDNMVEASNAVIAATTEQLVAYFAGERTAFDLPLLFYGTDFQQQVWRKLLDIPFGKTWSYGQLARSLGDIKASRAVGAANGKNPISIIVPCHRVIGSNGDLTGYAGGMEHKQFLLQLEGSWQPDAQLSLF